MGTIHGIPQKIRYHCKVCKKEIWLEYVNSILLNERLDDNFFYEGKYKVFFRIGKHSKGFFSICESSGCIVKRKVVVREHDGIANVFFIRQRRGKKLRDAKT